MFHRGVVEILLVTLCHRNWVKLRLDGLTWLVPISVALMFDTRNVLRYMYFDVYHMTCVSYLDTLFYFTEWNSTMQEIYNLCAKVWLDGKRESHCSHGGYYVTTTTTPWKFQRWQSNGQWSVKNLTGWWNQVFKSRGSVQHKCL